MAARRDARLIRHLRLDANDQVRISGLLGDQERVDPPGFTHQCHVGRHPLGDGFQESEISGSGQMPVLAIPHHEIQDVFSGGKHNDGGVAGLRPNLNDLVLGFDNAQHRPAVLSDQREDGE